MKTSSSSDCRLVHFLRLIFDRLTIHDVFRCRLVCKEWNSVAKEYVQQVFNQQTVSIFRPLYSTRSIVRAAAQALSTIKYCYIADICQVRNTLYTLCVLSYHPSFYELCQIDLLAPVLTLHSISSKFRMYTSMPNESMLHHIQPFAQKKHEGFLVFHGSRETSTLRSNNSVTFLFDVERRKFIEVSECVVEDSDGTFVLGNRPPLKIYSSCPLNSKSILIFGENSNNNNNNRHSQMWTLTPDVQENEQKNIVMLDLFNAPIIALNTPCHSKIRLLPSKNCIVVVVPLMKNDELSSEAARHHFTPDIYIVDLMRMVWLGTHTQRILTNAIRSFAAILPNGHPIILASRRNSPLILFKWNIHELIAANKTIKRTFHEIDVSKLEKYKFSWSTELPIAPIETPKKNNFSPDHYVHLEAPLVSTEYGGIGFLRHKYSTNSSNEPLQPVSILLGWID